LGYSIIIRNGLVIDPAKGTSEKRDLYVRDGKISLPFSPGAPLESEVRIIDAEGCYVSPGFIDAHGHFYTDGHQLGIDADTICPSSCVTTAIDQGSSGIYNFPDFFKNVMLRTTTRLLGSLSITNTGVQMHPQEEIQNPEYCDIVKIRKAFSLGRERLVGLKVRVHAGATREFGLAAIHRAQEVSRLLKSEGYNCRLTAHFADLARDVTLEQVLAALDRGDVLTHMYHETGNRIFDENGEVLACVKAARERGVLFDACDGLGHFSFKSLMLGMRGCFLPDLISTDVVRETAYRQPGFSLMNKISVYLAAGMPVEEVVRRVTLNPAKAYGISGAGSLTEGCAADIAVFRLIEKELLFEDLFGGSLKAERIAVPMATVRDGLIVFQQTFL